MKEEKTYVIVICDSEEHNYNTNYVYTHSVIRENKASGGC